MNELTRTHWLQVWLLLWVGIVAASQVGKAPVALPLIQAEFGLEINVAAWVLSAFPIVGGLIGAAIGVLVTHVGARRALLASLLLLAVSSALGSLAPGLGPLLMARVAEGLGLLAASIAAPAMMERVCSPRDRSLAFGVWAMYMPVGMAMAMAMTPLLGGIGWRGLWLVLAAVALATAIAAHLVLPKAAPSPAAQQHPGRDLSETALSPGPQLMTAIFFGWTMIWAILTGFLPTLLIERAGVSLTAAGLLAAAASVMTVIGNLAAGPLLRHGVPRWAILAFASGVVAVCALGIFNPAVNPWLAYALAMTITVVGGTIPSCVLGGAALVAPDRRLVAATLGMIIQGGNIGLIVGPAAVGSMVAAYGWSAAGLIAMAPALLMFSMAFMLRRLPGKH